MRADPSRHWLTGLAHSLPYDVALSRPGLADRLAAIAVPTLALDGDQGWDRLPVTTCHRRDRTTVCSTSRKHSARL